MKVTLKDIAKKSGYAVSTVSRVLNGVDNVSASTRQEIVNVALELDFPVYRINQPIGNHRVPNLRLVSDFDEGEFYASYFYGYTKYIRQQNVRLALSCISSKEQKLTQNLMELVGSGVDGIILFLPELTRLEYENILEKLPKNYPIISNALIESPVISTVTFDGYSGGHKAAIHFEDRGYASVGIVKGPYKKAESRFRCNGFSDYCTQSDKLELTWSFEGDFNFDAGVAAFHDFAQQENPPHAIFVCNDLMSLGFLEEAKRAGVAVPQDVALLGYDDMPLCQHTHPKLSTIHTDFTKLANATIQALVKQTKSKQNGMQHGMLSQIPVTLVQRETS